MRRYALAPLHAPAVFTGAKSFRSNVVIGSETLNRLGLHALRLRAADAMAQARRRRLSALLSAEDRAAFDRDGFVMRRNALPAEAFAALKREVAEPAPAREMRQGRAATRFIDATPEVLTTRPALAGFLRGPLFRGLLQYAASTRGEPIAYVHTVIAAAEGAKRDPQTAFHADTFHATSKGWLFLEDVDDAEGPFCYVPGSHRLTPGRIAWERAQSLVAARSANGIHAAGSFRAAAEAIREMGYGAPVRFAAPANTLVVADTHGFHARAPSERPSVRPAIYGSLRRNPFLPWTGLDPMALPGLREREGLLFGAWLDARERFAGKRCPQPKVGAVSAYDPTPRV